MSAEYDDLEARIDALHAEAEELADIARNARTEARATELREDARRKIRQAARLRAQMEGAE